MGCGAAPEPPPAPTLPGALPHAAITIDVQPKALLAGLDGIRDRMTGSLGPIALAWSKTEQALGDAIASLLPGRTSAPTLLAEWGIDASQSMRLEIAAPEASRMGRALVDVLSEREPQDPASVVVQARWHLGITEPDRFMQALGVLSARLGFDTHRLGGGARPAWIGAEPLAPTVRWVGRDPETGTWGCLQVVEGRATFDVLVPPKPGSIGALVKGLRRSGPISTPLVVQTVNLQLQPAEWAGVEAALAAHVGLRHPTAAVREASAEVLKACTERWQMVAAYAQHIHASIDLKSQLSLQVTARLTPKAQRLWSAATRPLPMSIWGFAAWRAGWRARGFGSPLGPAWIAETARCEAGHSTIAALGAWPLLPRVLPLRSAPLPPLLTALPWTQVDGAAAAIVDAAHLDGLATPVLAGVFTGAGPKPAQPLGSDAVEVMRDGEVRWRAVGGAPVEIGYRPDRIRVGLGPNAWRPAPPAREGDFLEAVLDARALAERLRAAGATGSEVAALAAVGERFGILRVHGRQAGEQLQLVVSLSSKPRGSSGGAVSHCGRWRAIDPAVCAAGAL